MYARIIIVQIERCTYKFVLNSYNLKTNLNSRELRTRSCVVSTDPNLIS